MDNKYFDVPVVLFVFRRLDTVKLIFDILREIKPIKLYVFADGAREGLEDERKKVQIVRDYVSTAVDWDCDFKPEYAEKNKGCAQRPPPSNTVILMFLGFNIFML